MTKRHVLVESGIEYVSHATNYCRGCKHSCLYCYSRVMQRISAHDWRHDIQVAADAADILRADIGRLKKQPTAILVSSSHDPYQPGDSLPTRQVLEVLAGAEFPAWVLTKGCHKANGGGLLPVRDFDLLQGPGCKFGVSITTLDDNMRERWELGAASIHGRFLALANAKLHGIDTWVSVEPVLPGLDMFALSDRLRDLADWVVVGKWNYSREADKMDWVRVREQAKEAFGNAGIPLLIKRELCEMAVA